MKAVEIRLEVGAAAPLLDLIREAAAELQTHPSLPEKILRQGAADFDFWSSELVESQSADTAQLLELFNADFFAEGRLVIAADAIEPIIRACAAIRLRLRSTRLENLDEEDLQKLARTLATASEIHDDQTLKTATAYTFLGALQTIVLENLDPFAADIDN